MKTFLSLEERKIIQSMLEKGYSHEQMGRKIGRGQSTVSREIKRNLAPYDANAAQSRHDEAIRIKNQKVRLGLNPKRMPSRQEIHTSLDRNQIDFIKVTEEISPQTKGQSTVEDRLYSLEEQVKVIFEILNKTKD